MSNETCSAEGYQLVENPFYIASQCVHVCVSFAAIICVYVIRHSLVTLRTHKNIKTIFLAIFACIVLHASVFIIFEVHHLVKTFTMSSNCYVLQPGSFCLFVRIAIHFYSICIVLLLLGLCIERTIATVCSSHYENFRSTFGILYCLFAAFIAIVASYIVNFNTFYETSYSCLNNGKDRIRVDIMNYTLTALNFVTFVWVVILYIENKCFSKKLDTHLSKRYQIQENLESTRITIVLGSLQLLFFTIHLTVNMVRRTHIGSMGTIPYRTLESVGYLFTYYSLVLSIIMGLFIRRERQTKIASLRENINKSAKGTQGSDFYFGLYSKRW